MRITNINFNEENFGITIKSLTELRNLLADKLRDEIMIFEIRTSELTCGFLILDWEHQNASFTGDGFRIDGGGEGGAGYKTAEILFNLFGIHYIPTANYLQDEFYDENRNLNFIRFHNFVNRLVKNLSDSEFKKPIDEIISYIR